MLPPLGHRILQADDPNRKTAKTFLRFAMALHPLTPSLDRFVVHRFAFANSGNMRPHRAAHLRRPRMATNN